eukprot:3195709-Rhodomonas_salina.1
MEPVVLIGSVFECAVSLVPGRRRRSGGAHPLTPTPTPAAPLHPSQPTHARDHGERLAWDGTDGDGLEERRLAREHVLETLLWRRVAPCHAPRHHTPRVTCRRVTPRSAACDATSRLPTPLCKCCTDAGAGLGPERDVVAGDAEHERAVGRQLPVTPDIATAFSALDSRTTSHHFVFLRKSLLVSWQRAWGH